MAVSVYFSDFFGVNPTVLEAYGAFNISLINDLPLFVDPFLLFDSDKPEYQQLHKEIVDYVLFLKDQALAGRTSKVRMEQWFYFPEKDTKQNWLGFSVKGNRGTGLGQSFAKSLISGFDAAFSNFGQEEASNGVHIEKLCLLKAGVGKDNISDLSTTLIKSYLLGYTQTFAKKHLKSYQCRTFAVNKVSFDYAEKRWKRGEYILPYFRDSYVLLTPKDILTKEDTWINRSDLQDSCIDIATAVPNSHLRAALSDMLIKTAREKRSVSQTDLRIIAKELIERYPIILDYYIKYKEENGEGAKSLSKERVREVEEVFIEAVISFVEKLNSNTEFYNSDGNTFEETLQKAHFLKDVIENKDGYRLFYHNGNAIAREADLQILFRLTWFATPSDVNREVNNGRGPVDFAISRTRRDKTNVEFKLASNTKLKQNLQNQLDIYNKAGNAQHDVKIIVFFNESERAKVESVLRELGMHEDRSVVLIDATPNKPSASKV